MVAEGIMLENVQVKEEEQKKAGRTEIKEMGRITVEASLVAARGLEREPILAVCIWRKFNS